MLRLIVGLGNPGRRYATSRHNIGFVALDALRLSLSLPDYKDQFSGSFTRGEPAGYSGAVALIKPMTFMNLSGLSVRPAVSFLEIDASAVVVLHDELDLGFGDVRVKVGGGHAGHKGLRSLMDEGLPREFVRVRVGVGRPPPASSVDVSDYVLSEFDPVERTALPGIIAETVEAVRMVLLAGPNEAMNRVNAKSVRANFAAKEAK